MSNFCTKFLFVLLVAAVTTPCRAQVRAQNFDTQRASLQIPCHSLLTLSAEQLKGAVFLHGGDQNLFRQPYVSAAVRYARRAAQKTAPGLKRNFDATHQIAIWLNLLEHSRAKAQSSDEIKEKIKADYLDKYVIKESEIPERYFTKQVEIARERGLGSITLTQNQRDELTNLVISDQRRSLLAWLNYFLSPDTDMYPMWAKYWVMSSVVKMGKFDRETQKFAPHSRTSAAPFVELNAEALSLVMNTIITKVQGSNDQNAQNVEPNEKLASTNFAKLYGLALAKLGIRKTAFYSNKGKWVMYKMGSDPAPLVASLHGQNTGWCTAASEETAATQLSAGDFYVYYSKDQYGRDTVPRIAIRMQGHEIAEIRGVANDQNLDADISDTNILDEKLKEFGPQAELYKKRSADMKRLTEIDLKQKNHEELSLSDLRFLYEIDSQIIGFGYNEDPRIGEITRQRNIRQDLSRVLGISPDRISLTQDEALSGGIIYHYGDIDLDVVTSAKGIKFPQFVSGYLNLYSLTSAEGLKLPQSVGRGLFLNSLTLAEGLKLPQSVGGELDLRSLTSAKGLTLPQSVGRRLFLCSLTTTEGLKLPQYIGGGLIQERCRIILRNVFE